MVFIMILYMFWPLSYMAEDDQKKADTCITWLFKMIVGVQLSSGNSTPNSETTTIWQFNSKVVCTVSRDRVRVYPGTEGTNQTRHWNHHRWHVTNSLERNPWSSWCLYNHKGCTYRAPVRYVTKTWSVVILNKNTHTPISSTSCMTSC